MTWESEPRKAYGELFSSPLALEDLQGIIRKLDTEPIKQNEPKQKRWNAEVKCRIIRCIGDRLPPGWTMDFSPEGGLADGLSRWLNTHSQNSWLGNTNWKDKKLSFNLFTLTRIPDNDEIEETAMHELAHAYHGEETQEGSNHEDRWHELCVKLGGKGYSCYTGVWYE